MQAQDKRFIIGIDLGTTNSAVSWVDLQGSRANARGIQVYEIPQLTAPGETSRLKFLPSFFYLPGEHEIVKEALSLPWVADPRGIAGFLAREQGARVPGRLVSSAKSWLCHAKVNRTSPILPWNADDQVPKVSPVEATAAYLRHIREAWNNDQAGDEDRFLENQLVVVTVPASFDQVARDLTVEAAAKAGIKAPVLLEEPLSAFYAWLIEHENDWREFIQPGELILVCDVGGGTTDLTLITLEERPGTTPGFKRIAVGDHLILGGDNMDLALARFVEGSLRRGDTPALSVQRWQTLCYQCRQAKETILGGEADAMRITLVGSGRKLIADTLSTNLQRAQVESTILEGFFPVIEPGERPAERPRQGITEFGLPYAQDPAITRHVIQFLERHRPDVAAMGKATVEPDLILFNGGALKPVILQERIREAIRHWFGREDRNLPRVLQSPELDLAVALGGSYYGLVKTGHGVRVGSGSGRAFYLGVGQADEGDGQGAAAPHAICLVERNMEEGTEIRLPEERSFLVATNQPVGFDLYSSSYRAGDHVGDLVPVDESLTPLPPLQTVIQFGKKGTKATLPVSVEAQFTELGTLAIWCRSRQTPHRWRLQFQLRTQDQPSSLKEREVFEESVVEQAVEEIRSVFKKEGAPPQQLLKALARTVERPKEDWPLGLTRRLADVLLELAPTRAMGPEHEARWLNLTGFCLRPGFGDGLDEHRVRELWKIFPAGPTHQKRPQVLSEWWVLWRRIAGGLSPAQQRHLIQEIRTLIAPGKKAFKRKVGTQEEIEIWMTLANLERIPPTDKAHLGGLLIRDLSPKKNPPQYWWAISRIGAREPFYGPVDQVVSPEVVSKWVHQILAGSWPDSKPVASALVQMARLTGDRKRDLDEKVRRTIIEWLNPISAPESQIKPLETVVTLTDQEDTTIFGESLPPGLMLHST
jgi:molecular chaperone DnaK (HSP70)